MMLPILIDELLAKKDSISDLKKVFLEADVDGSGFLDVGEIFAALKRMGAEISEDELAILMAEIDVDKNGMLDIDEFIQFMTLGDQIDFQSKDASKAFIQIQKARRLSPADFAKLFKNMPASFVPSFINELWKAPKCLPSSVFKAQVDPATMLCKDVRELRSDIDMQILEQINPKSQHKPHMRPLESTLAVEIKFIDAQGVPLPQNKNGFMDDDIVKRAVNIGIQYTPPSLGDYKNAPLPEFVYNSIQVPARWDSDNQDIWTFEESQLSQVLFRTTKQDRLDKGKTKIIFELVVHIKQGQQGANGTEPACMVMSCGWSPLTIKSLAGHLPRKFQFSAATQLLKSRSRRATSGQAEVASTPSKRSSPVAWLKRD
jgi:hypothetical protein